MNIVINKKQTINLLGKNTGVNLQHIVLGKEILILTLKVQSIKGNNDKMNLIIIRNFCSMKVHMKMKK